LGTVDLIFVRKRLDAMSALENNPKINARGGGVLPYMGCKGINRVSILADFGHKEGMVFAL